MAHREYERRERDTYFYYDDDADNNIGEELERHRRRKGKFLRFHCSSSSEDFFCSLSSVCMIYNVFLNVFYLVMYPKIFSRSIAFAPRPSPPCRRKPAASGVPKPFCPATKRDFALSFLRFSARDKRRCLKQEIPFPAQAKTDS